MDLFKLAKRYKNKLARRFSRRIERKQVNFRCDRGIYSGLKVLAKHLEVPIYPLLEHICQLGATEVAVIMQDPALHEQLCRHLIQDHLLMPVTQPEPETTTRRTAKIQSALRLVELMETATSSDEVKGILEGLINKVTKEKETKNE